MNVMEQNGKITGQTVSATVIVFNEEHDIGPCLESLSWCDEIVVVDSGSKDRTVEIARSRDAKVFVRPFTGFSEQKNFAADQTTSHWILSVDADETITPELQREIRQRLAADEDQMSGYFVPRLNLWLGTPIRHSGWYPDHTLRLYRKGKGAWGGLAHEQVIVNGATRVLEHPMIHNSITNLHDHLRKGLLASVLEVKEAKANEYRLEPFFPGEVMMDCVRDFVRAPQKKSLALRLIYKKRIKNRVDIVWLLPFYPLLRFLYMYVIRMGFLDGVEGFWLAYVSATVEAIKYSKIWEHFVHQKGKSTAKQDALEDATKLYTTIE